MVTKLQHIKGEILTPCIGTEIGFFFSQRKSPTAATTASALSAFSPGTNAVAWFGGAFVAGDVLLLSSSPFGLDGTGATGPEGAAGLEGSEGGGVSVLGGKLAGGTDEALVGGGGAEVVLDVVEDEAAAVEISTWSMFIWPN